MKYLHKIIFGIGFIYFSTSVILFRHMKVIIRIFDGMTHDLNVFERTTISKWVFYLKSPIEGRST